MNFFGIYPVESDDLAKGEADIGHIVRLSAKLVADCFTPELDPGLYLRREWPAADCPPKRDLGFEPDKIFLGCDIYYIRTPEEFRNWVYRRIDPFDPFAGTFASLLNCRQGRFGYDGQSILCLRLEDPIPVSPDNSLIVVEKEDFSNHDFFDGMPFGTEL